ncbi:MAG: hypothetical protein HYW91_01710 [Candidatus Sungbacteria bacterium]|nr:hypothetical protein [Candidatus Sungbacteria bacterium]
MGKNKIFRRTASLTLAVTTTLWLLVPTGAALAALTDSQIQSILSLLQSFGADSTTVANVEASLRGTTPAPAPSGACSFTRNLFQGVSGADVKCLQQYLNSTAYKVASSGVGSPGNETTSYGPLTLSAVAKWQAGNGVSPAVGYFGAISRAKYSQLVGGAPGPSPSPGVSPAPAGGLSVSVAPDNPAGSTLVADSTSGDGAQAVAPILKLRFTAGSGGTVKVTQLRIKREGISRDADFSNSYLYDGDKRIAEAPSVSGGYFTFTNSAGLFEVSANATKDVSFRVDLANGTSSGLTAKWSVAAATDVTSNAASVSGVFPVVGNEFRTATVSDFGKLTATSSAPTADATVDAGSTNYEVWKFTLQSTDQKLGVSYLKFTMVGTADYDAIQNLKLYRDGVQVGNTVAVMNSDKTLAFTFSPELEITTGVTKTFSLRGDVVKGSNRNFYFQIQNSADIIAKDLTYNVFVKPNQADVYSIIKPPTDVEITINAGSLSIQKSSDSPTGPLADGASNVDLAYFDFKAVGEDIKLSQVTVKWTQTLEIDNLKLAVDGVQIGTTVTNAASNTNHAFNPGGSFIVPAGVTKKLKVSGDLTDTTVADGDSIQVVLVTGSANASRQSSGTTFNAPSSDANANSVSITAGGLSVSKNSAVANISSVKGASSILIGSWLITAPSDQGVDVTSVSINNGTGTPGLGTAFDVMTLWNGSAQLGQTINSPSSATGTAQTFNLGTSLRVTAGQSVQIDLKANIITNPDDDWAGAADDLVKITTVNTTGVITNSAVNKTTDTLGQTMNILDGATVTLSLEATPTLPSSQYLVAGDTQQTLAAWKFAVNNSEDAQINRVEVRESHADDKPGNFRNIKLYVDGVQVGATVPSFIDGTATANTALFENTTNGLFTIPKNTSKTLVAKADITPNTDATFATDGQDAFFRINIATGTTATATTNVSGKGKTSGTFVTLLNSCSDELNCDGNAMKVVKTKPTFALVSPLSSSLLPGEMEVLRFRITAHSAEDVKLVSGTHNIRLTQTSAGTAATAYDFKLYDAATATLLATVSTATASAGTTNFTGGWSDIVVSKGTTKEFYVLANLTNFATTGNSFKVDIKNAAADFSWSDASSASADITVANFVGTGLPLTGQTFVKP